MAGAVDREAAASIRKTSRHAHRLCEHSELPQWAHDNAFIVSGYRRPGGTNAELHKSEVLNLSDRQQREAGSVRRRAKGSQKQMEETSAQAAAPTLFEHNSFRACWESVWLYWHNETVAIALLSLHSLAHFDLVPQFLLSYLPGRALLLSHAPAPGSSLEKALLRAQSSSAIPAASATSRGLSSLLRLSSNAGGSKPDSTAQIAFQQQQLASLWSFESSIKWAPNDPLDVLGFTVFGLAAVTCFGFSATFHTLHAHSCTVSKRANALDYIGIVVMIWGSFLPGLHYGFKCHPNLQAVYATMITVLSLFAGAVVLLPKFKTPAYRPWRTSVFILLGLSAVFPVAHAWALYGADVLARIMGIYWLIASGAMYIVGALLYTLRIPERFAPGKFDYIGASHQIFHVFILLAALAHYVCIRRAHSFWKVAASITGPTGLEGICQALETVQR